MFLINIAIFKTNFDLAFVFASENLKSAKLKYNIRNDILQKI